MMTIDVHAHRVARLAVLLFAVLFGAAALAQPRPDPGTCEPGRQVSGKVLGGVIGGLIGGLIGAEIGGHGDSRRAAAVAGSVIGALIGSRIGEGIDSDAEDCLIRTLEQADDGSVVHWQRQADGAAYRITPLRSFVRDGQRCRDLEGVVEEGGQSRSENATACRLGNGDWRLTQR